MGYVRNHTGDTYRMKNNKTWQIQITRDVVWTEKNRLNPPEPENQVEQEEIILYRNAPYQINVDENDHNLDQDNQNEEEEENQEEQVVAPVRQRIGQEVRGLQMYNNPGRLDHLERAHQVHFAFKVEEVVEEEEMEPTTFQEAWWNPNLEMREKWREAIRLEFHQMLKNGV